MNICKEIEKFALTREKFRQAKRRLDKGKRTAFWPSECSVQLPGPVKIGKCHRALWYSFKNEPTTNYMDGRGWRTVKAGLAFEALMIENIKEMNMWDAKMNDIRKFFNKELNISGEVDIFVKVDNKTIGVECKTIYGYWATKEVFTMRNPKIEHLMQTALYCYNFHPIPFKIIYGCRDSQEITEFDITLAEDKNRILVDGKEYKKFPLAISDIKRRFDKFQKHIDEDDIVPRDYSPLGMTDAEISILNGLGELNRTEAKAFKDGKKIVKLPWQCSYCDYGDMCRIEARKEIGGVKGRPDLVIVDEDKKNKNEIKDRLKQTNEPFPDRKGPSKRKPKKNTGAKATK